MEIHALSLSNRHRWVTKPAAWVILQTRQDKHHFALRLYSDWATILDRTAAELTQGPNKLHIFVVIETPYLIVQQNWIIAGRLLHYWRNWWVDTIDLPLKRIKPHHLVTTIDTDDLPLKRIKPKSENTTPPCGKSWYYWYPKEGFKHRRKGQPAPPSVKSWYYWYPEEGFIHRQKRSASTT